LYFEHGLIGKPRALFRNMLLTWATPMIRRLLSALRREQPQDAFGGDDLYEGEEEPRNMGRKIALGISGLLFASLLGLGVFVYIAGKDAPPPPPVAMMSLEDLHIEEEPADAAATPAAPGATPGAPGVTAPTPPDATAATDRSNERRPWLNAQPGAAAPGAAPTSAPSAKTAATPLAAAPAPTPASAPAPTTVAKAPGVITPPAPAMPMPPVTKITPPGPVATAPVPPPPAAKGAAPAAQAPTTPPPASLDALKPKDEHAPEPAAATDVADVSPVNVAPGAPERFAAKGELSSVGRPMLADPPLPPTDKSYLGAAPPRFGNLAVMKANAAPADDKAGKVTKIAIIVQGLGLNADATSAAIDKLPKNVTLSFSPYARDIRKWLTKAKNGEREVLVEVPMESKLFPAEDPGPLGLMTENEAKENTERLKAILRTFPGVIGIDDITGSKFRESGAPMADVFKTLKESKLIYVQGRPGVRALGEPGVPNAVADVVLDDRPFRAAIDARLDYTERLAKFQGSAVAVMSPRPVSFERLALWLQQLDKRGIQLMPISQVLVQSGPPA